MNCHHCNASFVNKYTLDIHIKTNKKCLKARGESPIQKLTILLKTSNDKIEELELELEYTIKQQKNYFKSKDEVIAQLTQQLEQKDKTIARITKKQSRPQFEDQNVIYVLTTPFLKQSNTYIIGKAINLTTRLSTYNKSDEHEVVYYRQCKDEHLLVTTETIILDKLKEYKELGNRDRITLPDDKNITFIIDIIDECITFMNK